MKSKPKRASSTRKTPIMPVVTIDVKKWGRYDLHDTRTGKYCAIGFAENQHPSFGGKAYRKNASQKLVEEIEEKLVECLFVYNIYSLIAITNDGSKGQTRRELLKKLFKEAGYQLKFKNL